MNGASIARVFSLLPSSAYGSLVEDWIHVLKGPIGGELVARFLLDLRIYSSTFPICYNCSNVHVVLHLYLRQQRQFQFMLRVLLGSQVQLRVPGFRRLSSCRSLDPASDLRNIGQTNGKSKGHKRNSSSCNDLYKVLLGLLP